MDFIEQFKTTEDYISNFESSNNISLPTVYKEFLLENKGGIPVKDNYYKELDAGVYDFEISVFYGMNTDDLSYDLRHNYVISLGEIQRGLLCFTDDGIGNYVCIGIDGDYLNKIYLCAELDDGSGYSAMLIDDDFESFLNNLN